MAVSIHSIKAGHDTGEYFKEAYEKNPEAGTFAPSEWYGEGAEMAGLAGSIERDDFERVLQGDIGGEQMHEGPGGAGKHKPGTALTFAPDKSVSIAALVEGDSRVTAAHTAAVKAAVDKLEQSGISYRDGGKMERGDNLTAAMFQHSTSRNSDPQLHTHVVVMNATKIEDGWRAISEREIYRMRPELEKIYQSELSNNLRQLGYQTEMNPTTGATQLPHVSQQAKDLFSSRSADIDDHLAHQGKNPETATAAEKQFAAYKTRSGKSMTESPLDLAEQRERWNDQLKERGMEHHTQAPHRTPVDREPAQEKVMQALDTIVGRLEHNKAVLEDMDARHVKYDTQHKVGTMSMREQDLRQEMRREVPGMTERQFETAVKSMVDEGRLHNDQRGGFAVEPPEKMAEMKERFAEQAKSNLGKEPYAEATKARQATQEKWRDAYVNGKTRMAKDRADYLTAHPKKTPSLMQQVKTLQWQARNPGKALMRAATTATFGYKGARIKEPAKAMLRDTAKGLVKSAVLTVKATIAVSKIARDVVQAYRADTNQQRHAGVQQVDRGAALKAAVSQQLAKRTISREGMAKIDEVRVGTRIRHGQMEVKKVNVKNMVLGAVARMEIRGLSERAAANIDYKRVGSASAWRTERAMNKSAKLQETRGQRLQAKAVAPDYKQRAAAYQQHIERGDEKGLTARMKVDLNRDLAKLQAQFGKDAPKGQVQKLNQALNAVSNPKATAKDRARAIETWSGVQRGKQAEIEKAAPRVRAVQQTLATGNVKALDAQMRADFAKELRTISPLQQATNPEAKARAEKLQALSKQLKSPTPAQRKEVMQEWTGKDAKDLKSALEKQETRGQGQGVLAAIREKLRMKEPAAEKATQERAKNIRRGSERDMEFGY